MAAEKQYTDAKRALRVIERDALGAGNHLTYGSLAEALDYLPSKFARHIGQVCSLIDAACFWAKLPMLSLEKVRMDDGSYNLASFAGFWAETKKQLIANSAGHEWTKHDIAHVIRALDQHMNGEGALLQWAKIESFGDVARKRALEYK